MNDALAEAMEAAGYRKLDRALAIAPRDRETVEINAHLVRDNRVLRERVNQLEKTNQRLVSELAEVRSQVPLSPILLKTILREVSAKHEVPIPIIKGDRRFKAAVEARQEYCWRACTETSKSLPEIGRHINRDHTTVMHHRDRRKARIDAGEVSA